MKSNILYSEIVGIITTYNSKINFEIGYDTNKNLYTVQTIMFIRFVWMHFHLMKLVFRIEKTSYKCKNP